MVDTGIITSGRSCRIDGLVVGRANSGVTIRARLRNVVGTARVECVAREIALGIKAGTTVLEIILTDALRGGALGSVGLIHAGIGCGAVLNLFRLATNYTLVDTIGEIADWIQVL